jgi:hypothetical protein
VVPTDVSDLCRRYRLAEAERQDECTPEERLLLAVVLQAVLDTLKGGEGSASARAFLDDPDIQCLAQSLWGIRTSGLFDRRQAEQAISAYRVSRGQKLQHRRRRRKK